MVLVLVLIGYACLLGAAGGRLMAGARWASRAPALAIVLWQAMGLSLVLAAASVGLTMALPTEVLADGITDFLGACLHTLASRLSTPSGALTVVAGLVLMVGVLGRAVWGVAGELTRARRCRRRQLAELALLGPRDADLGVYLVQDERTLAYCLPGRHAAVVLTTAARAALSPAELGAVLQHEAAHLRWRHDLVLCTAAGLRRAFPFVPALRSAETACEVLVEMVADDAAARRSGRTAVASALVSMAGSSAPRFALGVNAHASAPRAYRMLDMPRRLGTARRAGAGVLASALVTAPLAVTFAPALAVTVGRHCTFL